MCFPVSETVLKDSYKWHLGTPSHPLGLYSKENETPWCWYNCLTAVLGEYLEYAARHRYPSEGPESDAVRLRLRTEYGQKGKTPLLVLWMTLTESCISGVFLFIYAVHSKSLSFSSHRSVELCVLNKIVCLSERSLIRLWWNSSQLKWLRFSYHCSVSVLCSMWARGIFYFRVYKLAFGLSPFIHLVTYRSFQSSNFLIKGKRLFAFLWSWGLTVLAGVEKGAYLVFFLSCPRAVFPMTYVG